MGTQDVLRLESTVTCDLSSHLSVTLRPQAGKCGTGACHEPSPSRRTEKAFIQFSWFGTWGSPRKLPIQVTLTNTGWYWILRVKFMLLNSSHYCCRGECNLFEHDFFLWSDTWGYMAWDLAWSVSRKKIEKCHKEMHKAENNDNEHFLSSKRVVRLYSLCGAALNLHMHLEFRDQIKASFFGSYPPWFWDNLSHW